MMKITALYTQPDDPDAFEEHYLPVHRPLVDAMPGLVRQETARCASTADGGPSPYYRTADLYFPDQATIDAAFASEAGRKTARDAGELAARTGCQLTLVVCAVD